MLELKKSPDWPSGLFSTFAVSPGRRLRARYVSYSIKMRDPNGNQITSQAPPALFGFQNKHGKLVRIRMDCRSESSVHGRLTCLLGNEESMLLASSMTKLHFPLDFVMLQAENPPDSPLRRAISNRSERSTP